jgi:hypothetical protein
VNRSEFRYAWPLSIGVGTLGCVGNAVVFRANGVSYALNEAAASRGFAAVAPIRQTQGSGPPANPLRRLTQDNRMRIFSAFAACEGANAADCQRRVRIANALSEAEMTQIDAEGKERFWPPLEPKRIDLQPLIDAGVKLCGR